MSESTEQTETSVAEAISPHGVGELLARARENAGMSVDEVAAQLRLSVNQVLAMESGNLEALPAPAFVRGFIRNYARLLQIDAEPLLAAFNSEVHTAGKGSISLPSENIVIAGRQRKAWLPYLIASALLGLALLGWTVYMDYFAGRTSAPVQSLKVPVPELAQPAVVQPVPVVPTESTPPPEEELPQDTQQPAAGDSDPVSTSSAIRFEFAEPGWINVRDHDGKEIVSKTVAANGSEVIEGTPPFKVVIGNMSGTQVFFKDQQVDLAPYAKANVARFTLE